MHYTILILNNVMDYTFRVISNFQSIIRNPKSDIRTPTSELRHLTSDIRHLTSKNRFDIYNYIFIELTI
jgi:hypothetical protein